MLTGDLIRVRVRGKTLHPSFIDTERDSLITQARDLITIFERGVTQQSTRQAIEAEITDWIGDRRDHKLLRGLVKVAMDRSDFTVLAPLDPPLIRERVFKLAASRGPISIERGPLNRTIAIDILEEVAGELGCSAQTVGEALYADLKQAERITTCALDGPQWLLNRYNIALIQALLLKSQHLHIRLDNPSVPRMRQLFRKIKFHQLIHHAERTADTLDITLDGPTSLFSQSTRYGMQLATFFPSLLLQDGDWKLNATVLWTRARHKKLLEIQSTDALAPYTRDQGAYQSREQLWFRERFEKLDTEWTLSEGQGPIELAGHGLVLPDFTFENDGRVAHLEIIGFWKKDSLERRLKLLNRYGPGNIVLAISRKRRSSKTVPDGFNGPIVEFAEVIPPAKVLTAVDAIAIAS